MGVIHRGACGIVTALLLAGAAAADPPELVPVTAPGLLRVVGESSARVVVVNVWATWCIPCREEFPDLVRLHEEWRARGVEVIFVSADFDSQIGAAVRFLAEHGIEGTTYLKTGSDMDFIDALSPEWTGALPATFLYDRGRNLRHFLQRKTGYEELAGLIEPMLRGPDEEGIR